MSEKFSKEIRQRAVGAVLRNAIFSWQTAVTVGITGGLYLLGPDAIAIPGWQSWFWLLGGAVAEAAWIVSSLTDPEATREAIAREFSRQYDLSNIRNRVSRQRMKSAMEYRNNMLQLVKRHKGAMRMSLDQTVQDIDDWIAHMYDLAKHIDAFEGNELVTRDRQRVPTEIDATKRRIELEKDPNVRKDLEGKLKQLEQQLSNLEATVNSVKRAEIQLESTLSSLGTIYAQMSLLGTKEVDSARAQRLRLEIQDEVSGLQDTIDAMDEVQSQRLYLR
jgi:predicted RNase H-like nuclease (RuvC/YqgF family)